MDIGNLLLPIINPDGMVETISLSDLKEQLTMTPNDLYFEIFRSIFTVILRNQTPFTQLIINLTGSPTVRTVLGQSQPFTQTFSIPNP